MGNALAVQIVDELEKNHKPKRERIMLMEVEPNEEWFVRAKTGRGRSVMYLRLQITGLNSRLYGPFPSKRQALLFLDDVLNSMADALSEAGSHCEERSVKRAYQKVWPPIVEYPILRQLAR